VPLLDELLDWERRYWAAAGDPEFYDAHLAESALMVFPAPYGIFDRAATIEAVGNSAGWRSYELDEAVAVELGDDGAVLAYRARAVRADGSAYDAYVASVYVRREGEWKLALHQQTPDAG
jgi:hypothetical protein